MTYSSIWRLNATLLLMFFVTNCGQEENLADVYHGSDNNSAADSEHFPIKAGDRFVYQWALKRQISCQNIGAAQEDSAQIYQCIRIGTISTATGGEVLVKGESKFTISAIAPHLSSLSHEDFATIMQPSWFFRMLPGFTKNAENYNHFSELTYYTRRSPRPYDDLPSVLSTATLNFIDLRPQDGVWNGWDSGSNNSFAKEWGSYFLKHYSETNSSLQTEPSGLHKGGYSFREEINNDQALHAIYVEYNVQGALTDGEEVIWFDGGRENPTPSAFNVVSSGCKYDGSYIVKIQENFSNQEDLDYYWNRFCQ